MELTQLIKKTGKAGASFNAPERADVLHLVEECKSFMHGDVANLLEDHPNSPVLLQFSTDCTLIKTRQYYSYETVSGKSKSSSTASKEFLVMQIFLTMLGGPDQLIQRVVFPDPLELTNGKTMPALLACSDKFWSSTGSMCSPESITLLFQVHDRGISTRFRQAVAASHQNLSLSEPTSSELMGKRHPSQLIYLEAGCSLHDAHNSLKWVWQSLFQGNEETLKSLHLTLACYRAAIPHAITNLYTWLREHVVTLPLAECKAESELRSLYAALGADSSTLDYLCSEMHLFWDAGSSRLQICDAFMMQEKSLEVLSAVLQTVWRFPNFCSSRWLTVGASLRILLLGQATGWPSMFRCLREKGSITDYAGGYADKVAPESITFAAVIGLVSWLPETFMTRVLSDSRILMHYHALRESVAEELNYIETLPTSVWVDISSWTSASPSQFRDQTVRGAHVALAYLNKKVFDELAAPPWSLAIGDCEQNLREFVTSPAASDTDRLSAQLRALSTEQGRSDTVLLQILTLMQQCSFSTHFTERQHASAATLKRYHPDYDVNFLAARAYLHTFRP